MFYVCGGVVLIKKLILPPPCVISSGGSFRKDKTQWFIKNFDYEEISINNFMKL